MIAFVAALAAGGLALHGAMCEGWIGWEIRRRKPQHARPLFPPVVRRICWEMLDTFDGMWAGLREWFPVVLPALVLVLLVASSG